MSFPATAEARSSQITPSAPAAAAPDTLVLLYPEQKVADQAQARVAEFVAAVVPPDEWPKIRRQAGESLDALVNRVYDYYQLGEYAKPLTTAAIKKVIVDGNASVTAGTEIRVPPIPVRGNGKFGFGPRLRVFDTRVPGYAMDQVLEKFSAATAAATEGQTAKVVAELHEQRAASSTALTLSVAHIRDALAARGTLPKLPESVAVLSAHTNAAGEIESAGFSVIEFLAAGGHDATAQAPTTTMPGCDAGSTWLGASSYRQLAAARLTAAAKAALIAKAKSHPLVLFDFDFTGAGHGNKVRSVVQFALQSFGLVLDSAITTVDFLVHDQTEKEALDTVLSDFMASLGPNHPYEQVEPHARDWIANKSELVIFGPYRIHDLVVRALLWKYWRGPAVVNLSFRLRSPMLELFAPQLLAAQPSVFAIIAAGNEAETLQPFWVPQDAPQNLANTINVTHGLLDGTILGTRSADGNPFRGVVSLLAPGCGFASGQVIPTDSGSSLAAPYTATAVWLKQLLDGETGPALRRSILRAVVPMPAQPNGIESGGIFDPARLLAKTGPHLRMRDGTIVPVADAVLTVQCAGDPSDVVLHYKPKAADWQSVALTKDGGGFSVWSREISRKEDVAVRIRTSCHVVALQFSAGSVKFDTLAAFEQAVSEWVM